MTLSSEVADLRAARIRKLIRERKRRSGYFRADLFADPAWDTLLQLYASELSYEQATATRIADIIDVPTSTVLRWIKVLEAENLVTRAVQPSDPKLVSVKLTSKGQAAINGYFRGGPGA
ncbi:MarR family transcriptional regulator [Sphingomonas piscis]|uniref:MarR family transcriptional regulator n=1 Tax=Sphingomonas piscis TaxID=2714943 RepID=A0A6G7YQ44_9SPHN|nr:MarR family transcriptional regulator [Sphingomonas piscis]